MPLKKPLSFLRLTVAPPILVAGFVTSLVILGGCARTTLSKAPFDVGSALVAQQAARSSRALGVCLRGVPETLGHQFGLIVLPLGVIVGGKTTEERIHTELEILGARRGVSVRHTCDTPQVVIEFSSISLDALDFVFVRRVSAQLSGVFRVHGQPGGVSFESRSASWRRFGYSAQLDAQFHRAISEAFFKLPFEKLAPLR